MEIFLFILGYYVHFAASCLLLYKIWKHKSIYGLSIDTQASYLIAVIGRCVWSMETRLVETVMAYFELGLSTVVASVLCYFCFQYRHTMHHSSTIFLRVFVTAPIALVLAFFFHPGDDWWTMQILVAFTMYQEALGMLPQLYLMQKMHEVEPLTSHYVGLLVCARIIRVFFWGKLYFLGEHFLQLLLADVVHTLFSVQYLYLWCYKLRYGGSLVFGKAGCNI